MGKYINKSALLAEIERRISNHNKELKHASDEDFVSSWASDEENQKFALVALIPFINTLEVKEVDLEKEIQDIHKHFHDYYGIVNSNTGEFAKVEDIVQIAKHFFELGLKTKGE